MTQAIDLSRFIFVKPLKLFVKPLKQYGPTFDNEENLFIIIWNIFLFLTLSYSILFTTLPVPTQTQVNPFQSRQANGSPISKYGNWLRCRPILKSARSERSQLLSVWTVQRQRQLRLMTRADRRSTYRKVCNGCLMEVAGSAASGRTWRIAFLTLRDETLMTSSHTSFLPLLDNLIFSNSSTLITDVSQLPPHEVYPSLCLKFMN